MDKVERWLRGFYIYGEVSGIGKIYTPKNLRNRMLEIAQPKKTDKILILYNLEFASDLRDYDYVFASDDLDKNEIVEQAFGKKTVFIEDNRKISESLKKVLENMKFDLIISNPPYNQNLDLKILKDVYNLSEKICFVHPAGWILDNRNINSLWKNIKKMLSKDSIFLEIFKTHVYFNAWTFVPNAINYIKKQNNKKLHIEVNDLIIENKYYTNSFFDVDVHGASSIYKSLKNKILKYCYKDNVDKNRKYNFNSKEKYYLGFSRCSPGGQCVMIPKTNKKDLYDIMFVFETQNEILNFKNYLKTKIARFCLSINKIKQDLNQKELASVPYMPTYKRSWTDEDVAKELGLTEEELAWAINWIPDYYPEDPEIYAKWKN